MTEPDVSDALDLPPNGRALLDALVAISSDLELRSVLDRIVVSACEITGARYGALGVLGRSGGLAEFITHGIDAQLRERIGPEPSGHGILGLLIADPRPLRLPRIADHPESYGFPAHHPPMETFLGVPVRVHGRVFGNLYLTDKAGGAEFTKQDEHLVGILATAAGFVVQNARAYARSEQRRLWLEGSGQLVDALQPPVRPDEALREIAATTRQLSGAAAVAVLQQAHGQHRIGALDGMTTDVVPQLVDEHADEIRRVEKDGEPVALEDDASRRIVVLPLRPHLAEGGVLFVLLSGDRALPDADEVQLLSSFAHQAALALDRAQAMSDRQELMLVSDRDRIARDLHDLVIQRLFATGLQLQGARRIAVSDEVQKRLDDAVKDLDETIRDIRSTIFELQHSGDSSLRADLRSLVKEYVPVLGFTPLVRTSGPVDTMVGRDVAQHVLAVLREALSNVAKHAGADASVVELHAGEERVLLTVTDNGRGVPDDRHESGLRNIRRRATDLGGETRVIPEDPNGTRLEWWAPLDDDTPSRGA